MRYAGISFVCVLGFFASIVCGQENKPNFSGNWRLVADKSQIHDGKSTVVSVLIEQKGSSIHVVRKLKDSTLEFTCTTDGKDCDANGVKVSFWYDGPALVEMDISDDLISKTTMTLDEPGTICASVTYITPKATADALVFEKAGV